MSKPQTFAVTVIRTMKYVETVVVSATGEDAVEARDNAEQFALDKVKSVKTDGSTFKLLGQEDEIAVVMNDYGTPQK